MPDSMTDRQSTIETFSGHRLIPVKSERLGNESPASDGASRYK